MSTHNICFHGEIRKYFWIEKSILPRAMSEQQIILEAFGYLTPSKLNQLGKIVFSFFGLSKDTPKMKTNWVKLIKLKERV